MRNRFVMLLFSALICFSLILNSVNLSPVQAESQPYNPSVFAMSSLSDWGNSITSYGWPLGNVVTFSIYHSYPGDPYYSSDQIEVTNTVTEDPTNTIIVINLPKETYAILPGDTVVMTDGTVTKTVVVSLLQFTKIDYANDIVEGIANPGTRIDMWACDQMTNNCVNRHVDTPPDGNLNQKWSVDFSQPGSEPQESGTIRLMASTWLNSVQNDTDGDGTNFGVGLNGPSINVFAGLPQDDSGINADGWEFGKTLYLTILDQSGTEIYSGERRVENYTDYNPNLTHVSFQFQHDVLKILPEYIVRINDGTIYKETIVTGLIFQKMDFTHDTISGIAEPFKRVNVWACNEQDFYANRHAYANLKGEWIVDFSQPGTEFGEYDLLNLKGGFWANSNQRENNYDGDYTYFGNSALNSRFEVRPNDNQIFAFDWPVGNTVYVDIDDPHNGAGTDFSTFGDSQLGTPWDPNQPQPYLVFDLNGQFDIQSGDFVTLHDEVNTKTITVPSLSYSDFDLEDDIITGQAEVGIYLDIYAENAVRHVIVDDQGNWAADFGVPGSQDDEQSLSNLDQGMWLDARWTDQDGDSTAVAGYIMNPRIEVDPNGNWITPREWPDGTEMLLEIDDISNGPGVDYSETGIMHLSPDNPGDLTNTLADFEWPDSLLPPYSNYVITVTGSNGVSETYAVAPLTLTSYDLDNSTLTGTATPLTEVWVNANVNNHGVNRYAQSDPNGYWTVDFSQPGAREDEQETITDLKGIGGFLAEADAYWNRTLYDWQIPNPTLEVRIWDQKVSATGWAEGAELTLVIDDPNTPENTSDYIETLTMPAYVSDPTQNYVLFDPGSHGFTLNPGQIFSVSGEGISKSIVYTNFFITNIDQVNDVIYGEGTPGQQISTWLWVSDENINGFIDTLVGISGDWSLDYSGQIDLHPWVFGMLRQQEEDGDSVIDSWRVINPVIEALISNNSITFWDWPMETELTISIDDPSTTLNPDYQTVKTVNQLETVLWRAPFLSVTLDNEFSLRPGMTITATGGGMTDSLTIASLEIESINLESDTVSGIATSGAKVRVYMWQSYETILTDSNPETGIWSANFSGIRDIVPGTLIRAVIRADAQMNSTFFEAVALDIDRDGIWDTTDNASLIFNPDQRDIDSDGEADVVDPCPSDPTDTCNTSGSTATSIGSGGGTLSPENGAISVFLPEGALKTDTSMSITDKGSGFLVTTDQGQLITLSTADIGPAGTIFVTPIKITFQWSDSDNNGVVDGTLINEADLVISKDGVAVAGPCGTDSGCDMVGNHFVIQVSSLSFFVLGAPPNNPPVATLVSAPIDPVIVNSAVSATVWFSDPDIGDTHLVTWDWGDSTTSTGIVNEVNGSASGSHTYAIPGVYTVIATVTDFGGESSTASFNYIVVYDPNGGFITGGGWAMTSPGDYTGNPTLSGKVNFGFDSKYHKFALFPKGNTRFDFKLTNLDFKSTSYYWMFVGGAKAQIRGSATINGSGDYGFIVTIIDGKLLNGSNLDYFRMKIWNKSTGAVIYDNQPGAADNADPTMLIKGGSITIHNN